MTPMDVPLFPLIFEIKPFNSIEGHRRLSTDDLQFVYACGAMLIKNTFVSMRSCRGTF